MSARRDDPRPGVLVELAGLPGSGKTTLASALRREAADAGVPIALPRAGIDPEAPTLARVGRKLGLVGAAAVARPAGSARTWQAIWASQDAGRAARILQWSVTERLLATAARAGGVHLLDEGVVQALWSIGLRGDVRPVLRALEVADGRVTMPDVVIAVRLGVDEIERRLGGRGSRHSRVQSVADPRARRAELERGEALLDPLLAWCRTREARPGTPVGVIDVRGDAGRDDARAILTAVAARSPSLARPPQGGVVRPSYPAYAVDGVPAAGPLPSIGPEAEDRAPAKVERWS